jgi:hypothetical protein
MAALQQVLPHSTPPTLAGAPAAAAPQYERLGMTSHYSVFESMFTGY